MSLLSRQPEEHYEDDEADNETPDESTDEWWRDNASPVRLAKASPNAVEGAYHPSMGGETLVASYGSGRIHAHAPRARLTEVIPINACAVLTGPSSAAGSPKVGITLSQQNWPIVYPCQTTVPIRRATDMDLYAQCLCLNGLPLSGRARG